MPWFRTIQVAFDLDVILEAEASDLNEFGDVRCQITGDSLPASGVIDYGSYPDADVECIVSGSP